MNSKAIIGIENLRDRLVDLVNGDKYVDIGTLLYCLNENLAEIGGRKRELKDHEIKMRFFQEKEEG